MPPPALVRASRDAPSFTRLPHGSGGGACREFEHIRDIQPNEHDASRVAPASGSIVRDWARQRQRSESVACVGNARGRSSRRATRPGLRTLVVLAGIGGASCWLWLKTDGFDTWWPNWAAQYIATDWGWPATLYEPFDLNARRHRAFAEQYYLDQRRVVLAAAVDYPLGAYWESTARHVHHLETSYYNMAWKRVSAMVTQLKTDHRDDFKIEKNKCVMYKFFQRNNFPIAQILGYWDDPDEFLVDLERGRALNRTLSGSEWRWPIFIKFCHLTQGWAASTKLIASAGALERMLKGAALREWVSEKWLLRPDDPHRPWRSDANVLTDTLSRGIMLQSSGEASFNPGTGAREMVELKTEVLWGVAVLAGIEFDNKKSESGAAGLFARRKGRVKDTWTTGIVTKVDTNGSARLELFPSMLDTILHESAPQGTETWLRFISDERHLKCAFRLAERVARTVSAEQLRVDVFIVKGQPDACLVNEISLTSGSLYAGHMPSLAKLWSEPFLHRTYRVFDSGKEMYMQNESDIPVRGTETGGERHQ